jgi:Tfp pilus assembly protein PilF
MRPLSPEQLENKHYFEGAKNWFTTCRNLGFLFVEKNEPDKAEYWFLQALNHSASYFDPDYSAGCHAALAKLYLKQGRLDDARAQLAAALSGTKQPHTIYNLLGVAAAKQNDNDAAEGFFLKALEADPDYAAARNNLKRLRRQSLAGEQQ